MNEESHQLRGPVAGAKHKRPDPPNTTTTGPRETDVVETTQKVALPEGASNIKILPKPPPKATSVTTTKNTVNEPTTGVIGGTSSHPEGQQLPSTTGIIQPPPYYFPPPSHLYFGSPPPPPHHHHHGGGGGGVAGGVPIQMISLARQEAILSEMNRCHKKYLKSYAEMEKSYKDMQKDYQKIKKELTTTKHKLQSTLEKLATKESACKEAMTAKRAAERTLEKEIKKAAKKAANNKAPPPPLLRRIKPGPKQEDIDKKWMERFSQLKVFKAKFGHCNATRKNVVYSELGHWVGRQRRNYNLLCKGRNMHSGAKSPMTAERIRLLNDLGFEWNRALKPRMTWEERFEQLQEYKTKHGDCNVPCVDPLGLGQWVQSQRKYYSYLMGKTKKPKDATISINEERIAKLQDIGFEFSLRHRSCQKLPRNNNNNTPPPDPTEQQVDNESQQQQQHQQQQEDTLQEATTPILFQQTPFDVLF